MNRADMIFEFVTCAAFIADPLKACREFCKNVGIPPKALAHTSREVLRVVKQAHNDGAATPEQVAGAAADYIADLVGES
jgi:hypothetical protein